ETAELAALFFAETTPEAASVVFRALSEDNLFFKRKGAQFLPRSDEQISAEMTRRQRQRQREDFREHAMKIVAQLVKGNAEVTDDVNGVMDRIQNWLRYRTGDEIAVILEETVGAAKARDVAYDILLRGGRVDPALDRFLVTTRI